MLGQRSLERLNEPAGRDVACGIRVIHQCEALTRNRGPNQQRVIGEGMTAFRHGSFEPESREPVLPILLFDVVQQWVLKTLHSFDDLRTSLQQRRAGDNDLSWSHEPMRVEPRVLAEAVPDSEINRVRAQIGNCVASFVMRFPCCRW